MFKLNPISPARDHRLAAPQTKIAKLAKEKAALKADLLKNHGERALPWSNGRIDDGIASSDDRLHTKQVVNNGSFLRVETLPGTKWRVGPQGR